MPTRWKRLYLAEAEGLVPLLFKYSTNPKGYELYLTDLTHLWSERLNYNTILKRAEKENTTIDPTEDPGQFVVLLEKIGEALHSPPGSHISVKSGEDNDSLELNVSTKLPAPLKPLEWPVYLTRESQPLVAEHLLIPLLKEKVVWESQKRSLLDQIKQKDWVLGKLFDKIEMLGINLSTVFPGITGLRTSRKGTAVDEAAKLIRGAAPFNEQQWLKEIRGPSIDPGLAANVVSEVSGSTDSLEGITPAPEKWWENLEVHSAAVPATSPEREEAKRDKEAPRDTTAMETDGGSETEDDEFERQETPPEFKHQKDDQGKPDSIENNEKLKARSESDSRSPSPPTSKTPAKTKDPRSGLRVIGKRKPEKKASASPQLTPSFSSTDPEPSPAKRRERKQAAAPPRSKREDQPTDAGIETESDEDKASVNANEHEPSTFAQHKKTPPLSQSHPQPQSSSPGPAPSPAPAATPVPKKSPRLGVIGGKKKQKQQKEPSPPSQPLSKSESETDSDSENENDNEHKYKRQKPTTSPEPKPKPQTAIKRPGKLGVIGKTEHQKQIPSNRAKDNNILETKDEKATKDDGEDEETNRDPISSTTRHQKKKTKKFSPSEDANTDADTDTRETMKSERERPIPSAKHEPKPEPAKETEQDKANRRRDELKRQLEAKSKAPAKKKRKF